jgi:hypothetical protein
VAERDQNAYPKIENARSLRSVAEAARACQACDLWSRATQTVFGEGPRTAKVVFVGEQLGTRKISPGIRSSVRRDVFSTRHWRRPVSTGNACSSRTR